MKVMDRIRADDYLAPACGAAALCLAGAAVCAIFVFQARAYGVQAFNYELEIGPAPTRFSLDFPNGHHDAYLDGGACAHGEYLAGPPLISVGSPTEIDPPLAWHPARERECVCPCWLGGLSVPTSGTYEVEISSDQVAHIRLSTDRVPMSYVIWYQTFFGPLGILLTMMAAGLTSYAARRWRRISLAEDA